MIHVWQPPLLDRPELLPLVGELAGMNPRAPWAPAEMTTITELPHTLCAGGHTAITFRLEVTTIAAFPAAHADRLAHLAFEQPGLVVELILQHAVLRQEVIDPGILLRDLSAQLLCCCFRRLACLLAAHFLRLQGQGL